MPCYLTGSAEGDAKFNAEEARKEATKLTRLLCAVCTWADRLEKHDIQFPGEVRKWWENHQEIDKKRKLRESK